MKIGGYCLQEALDTMVAAWSRFGSTRELESVLPVYHASCVNPIVIDSNAYWFCNSCLWIVRERNTIHPSVHK